MAEGEMYCPSCKSPRLVGDQASSGIGIKIVLAIVVASCVGVVLKFVGVF
jgi:hypothetical protein